MKKLSAQYIFTNNGPALKRGIITAQDDGTITNVEDTGGELRESASVEFHNGIIIPGFVNCHTHLELSHLKGCIQPGKGLAEFIRLIRLLREIEHDRISSSIVAADLEMQNEGTVLCADICNSSATFGHKKKSRVKYINLLEIYGLNPHKAGEKIREASALTKEADLAGLNWQMAPHSVYAVSLSLLRMIKEICGQNKVTSIHFMESKGEMLFLSVHRGPLRVSYRESGLDEGGYETPKNHITAILDEVTPSGNLILVHNTHADAETVKALAPRKNLYWCLCPNSNLHIEDKTPPLSMLLEQNCKIVIGTDSLASNSRLSILEELKTLQGCAPETPLEEMILWATLNGAKALGEEKTFGSIEPGKKPGLLLIRNVNLNDLKLMPGSIVNKLL